MMLRCTWLVPPAMRPAGEASRPSVSGPSSIAAAPAVSARSEAMSNDISEMPSLSSELPVVAMAPPWSRWRWASALYDVPRAISDASCWRATGAELALGAERAEALQPPLQRDDRRADVAALVRQHAHPDAPAAVQRAEQAVGGQLDVGEEDLVELGRRRSSARSGRISMPGRSIGHRKNEMPSCLARLGVRAGHQDAPVADPSARAPHLLAVDDEVVAVALGLRRQAAEVAAGARLGEQLAPHLVAVAASAAGAGPAARACRTCRRAPPARTSPTMLSTGGTAGLGALDQPRRLVLGRQALAAVLDGPVDAGVAGLVQQPLPRDAGRRRARAGRWRRSPAAPRPCARPATRRRRRRTRRRWGRAHREELGSFGQRRRQRGPHFVGRTLVPRRSRPASRTSRSGPSTRRGWRRARACRCRGRGSAPGRRPWRPARPTLPRQRRRPAAGRTAPSAGRCRWPGRSA